MNLRQWIALAALAALSSGVAPSGAHAAGVPVGSSTLIDTLDYSDSFTITSEGGNPGRPGGGAFPVNSPGINVENNYGNPAKAWSNFRWSIAEDATVNTGGQPYVGSGSGTATGMTQTGGGVDYGIEYGLRNQFVVQFDAFQVPDRIDITAGAVRDGIAGGGNGLSVFFRTTGSPTEIGLYNGISEINSGLTSGIPAINQWHNYAVGFDRSNGTIEVFVDEVSRGIIDLTTFNGGTHNTINNAAINVGGTPTVNRFWSDNFQLGGLGPPPPPPMPHPNPGPIANPPPGLCSYWDFDEASGPEEGFTLNFAYDRVDGNHGSFSPPATRVPGLVGVGAAQFNNASTAFVDVGPGTGNNFSATTGITVEALIDSDWSGGSFDYDEIFRKEDGGNRILLSFQNDPNNPGANPPVAPGPVLSFGLNVNGAYGELDMPLDGSAGITLDDLRTGVHHVVATYDSATGEKAIWIDGLMMWSVNLGPGSLVTSGGGANAYIGSIGASENFNGIIDEVAFWKRGLSEGEIQTHFVNTLNGNNYFIPEPSTVSLTVLGLVGMILVGCRRRRSAST